MTATEVALARRLRHMQWLATGLLIGMGILFVLTSLLMAAYPWLGVVAAFAEAGMIGALADWFAVTALFRRPLGLPIPHTAIVPSRKNEIGQALAYFIRDHFLVKNAVLPRLSQADLAGRLGTWLARSDHAHLVSQDVGHALDWLLNAVDSTELRQSLRKSLKRALEQASVSAGLSVIFEVFTSGNHAQALVDQLIHAGREQLSANQENIRQRIKDRSPWWLPKFVDEKIFEQLIDELQRILSEIGDDPQHSARRDFTKRLNNLRTALSENPAVAERSQILRDEFFTYLVETYQQPLSEIVSDTIGDWDPTATAERIELYIGRDLQFIRINGTLVGGLVGVLIYVVWGALPL
jgi:uncharacterized membrane-anchored protein YjiN (DUF445 family)